MGKMRKMSNKKKDNDIICITAGNQSFQVTGSNTVVSYMTNEGRKHLLVDIGISQGGSEWDEYIDNKKLFDNIPIKYAEYCFITHFHSDHAQGISALIPRGFEGRILLNETNKIIAPIMLKDGTKIHNEDCVHLRKVGHKCKDLYTMQDMYHSLDKIEVVPMNKIIKLDDYVSFRYNDNSHILGATILELFIKKEGTNTKKKICFVGDLGNTDNFDFNYFAKPTKQIKNADVLYLESTYGKGDRNFNKKDCIAEREDLKNEIITTLNNNGNVLIPCFSQHRLQNMMCWLYDNFKDTWNKNIPIVVDTNLGCKINTALLQILEGDDLIKWKEVMSWDVFKYIDDYQSSIAFMTTKQKALILSSSGMVSGGRSLLHAHNLLGQKNSAILFCGYCSPNCVGGQILDNTLDKVEFSKNDVVMKQCKIKAYRSFSSHASQKDLINFVKNCNCNKVVLMHGDEESKIELKYKLEEMLHKNSKTTKVILSTLNGEIKL